MTTQAVFEFIGKQGLAATGLAALGAALDARASGTPLDPGVAKGVDELLVALGAGDILAGVKPEEALPILAVLRFTLGLENKMLFSDSRSTIWNHTEDRILQAGGDGSVGHAFELQHVVIPQLGDLSERLSKPGAKFLDVGTGVGMLGVAMARLYPELDVVGIDPWQPSLSLARKNVREAGLERRIELREQAVEALTDHAAFDLVWLPSPFMQAGAIEAGCARAHAALRSGGWLIVAMLNFSGGGPVTAQARLRSTLWGGHVLSPEDSERMLRDNGLGEVRTLPSPPGMPVTFVVGRRNAA